MSNNKKDPNSAGSEQIDVNISGMSTRQLKSQIKIVEELNEVLTEVNDKVNIINEKQYFKNNI